MVIFVTLSQHLSSSGSLSDGRLIRKTPRVLYGVEIGTYDGIELGSSEFSIGRTSYGKFEGLLLGS